MDSRQEAELRNLSALLQLEALARKAESVKALQFLVVNETRRLVSYRQAFLFTCRTVSRRRWRVEAASSVPVIARDAPFIRWLESLADSLFTSGPEGSLQRLDAETAPEKLRQVWNDYSLPFALWCPLRLPDGVVIGGLWLARETPWQENEATLVKRLTETYAHAWAALAGRKNIPGDSRVRRLAAWAIVAGLIALMFVPVRLSTLAPVEVVAKDPVVVSAPIDGVIEEVLVPPNTHVAKGDVIFRYEDTRLRSNFEVAEKSLEVAMSEYRKASQGAFRDEDSKAQVALLKAQAELKAAELDYARELLKQVEVTALMDGLLLYGDKAEWVGRPVVTGERIMHIADPDRIKLRINLPVADAIILSENAEVEVYLDIDPLKSLPARVTHASYNASLTPEKVLAYNVDAEFLDAGVNVRIGLQGTAKIYGGKVSLFFYLFRRPVSALRQFTGL